MTESEKGKYKRPVKRTRTRDLVDQVKESSEAEVERKPEYDGNIDLITSTGSTLMDLEISGERIRGGGIPAGILVEVFGKNSMGKTVILCEIAGGVQRAKGEVMFKDPEARLNKTFSRRLGLNPDKMDYTMPDTIPEVFESIRAWTPKNTDITNGIFSDSLAALSTDLEMEEGDKMGMRRAKEFSQEARKTCRHLVKNNLLLVCSNQLRATGAKFGKAEDTTGGNAIPYYASLRIGLKGKTKMTRDIKLDWRGNKKSLSDRKYGISVTAYIEKSSVGMDGGEVPIYILSHYGIDDIRANLQWYKENTGSTGYFAGGRGMDEAISKIEQGGREAVLELRDAVIDLWEEIRYLTVEKEKNRLEKVRW